jgi:hypothetical protein
MFDAGFFQDVLPDYVAAIAAGHRDQLPVVHLHLVDGTIYDLCRILGMSNAWLAAAYFREPANCDDVEIAFLHPNTIVRVTISLPNRASRTIGFGSMPDDWLAQSPALHGAAEAAA